MYYVLGNTFSDCYPAVKSTRERDMERVKWFCSRVKLLCIFSGWQASEKCNILDTLICLLNKILNYSVPVSLMLLFSHDKNSAPESTSVSFFNWNMIFFFFLRQYLTKLFWRTSFTDYPQSRVLGPVFRQCFWIPQLILRVTYRVTNAWFYASLHMNLRFPFFPCFFPLYYALAEENYSTNYPSRNPCRIPASSIKKQLHLEIH